MPSRAKTAPNPLRCESPTASQQDDGDILVEGKVLPDRSPHIAIALGIGMVQPALHARRADDCRRKHHSALSPENMAALDLSGLQSGFEPSLKTSDLPSILMQPSKHCPLAATASGTAQDIEPRSAISFWMSHRGPDSARSQRIVRDPAPPAPAGKTVIIITHKLEEFWRSRCRHRNARWPRCRRAENQ